MINNDIQRVIRCDCSGGFWKWKEDEKRERERGMGFGNGREREREAGVREFWEREKR